MECALRMVDRRCAMVSVVRPAATTSSAACTARSLRASSAEVASSSSSTLGFLMTARAMAMRCFWPPLSWMPPSPTRVCTPSGSLAMKSDALAARAAASTSSRLAPGAPYAMLSAMVPANSSGSCDTSPTCCLIHLRL
mmetsp:Transcript_13766/g.33856  ORF Transcript_13766/g.33856 Transcript_13766/m.33856 type:complete len:138 (-) Transcript_13766:4166-4579(-)